MNIFCGLIARICFLYAFMVASVITARNTTKQSRRRHVIAVHTTSGPVEGLPVRMSKNERVFAFLGIPYAEPPVGDLRFRPPVRKTPWNDTFEAFQFKPVCLQPGEMPSICDRMWTGPPPDKGFEQSEDCLTLNIFTANLSGSFPVMFFIHGGSYIVGAGGLHPGERLAYTGAVVVTFNYRLGVFGFLSTADSAAPGNYGLMDQVMAMEWIYDNIHRFGGNPFNITIFGQSAGAAAVHLHLLSNKTRDLFTNAVMHSGVALAPWAIQRMPAANARVLAEAVNCPTSPSTTMVSCLRNRNESDILWYTDLGFRSGRQIPDWDIPGTLYVESAKKSYRHLQTWTAGSGSVVNGNRLLQLFSIPWAPVVDGDWIVEEPEILLQKGQIQNKSVIIGVTDDEATIVLYNLPGIQVRERPFNMTKQFVIDKVIPRLVEEAGYKNPREIEAALKFYYIDTAREESVNTMRQNYAQMLTDAIFTSGVLRSIKYHSQIEIPTFFFVFDYHSWNDSLPTWTGAYHGVDLKYLFGCPFKSGSMELQEELDKVISDLMMKLWINFAQNGNPIGSHDFTEKIGWSPYVYDGGQYYLNISASLPRRQQYYRHEHVVFWNSYMPMVASLGSDKSAQGARNSSSDQQRYYITMMWLAAAVAIFLLLIILLLLIKLCCFRKKGRSGNYKLKSNNHADDHQNGPHAASSNAGTAGRSASKYLEVPERL